MTKRKHTYKCRNCGATVVQETYGSGVHYHSVHECSSGTLGALDLIWCENTVTFNDEWGMAGPDCVLAPVGA